MDPKKHEKVTGISNESILENYQKLCLHFKETVVTVRTPIIPGVNDTAEDIEAISRFIKSTGKVSHYELLPYHQFGESKYYKLGKKFEMKGVKPPSDAQVKILNKIAV
jgi:pyruvate formate lyase activating enzyme